MCRNSNKTPSYVNNSSDFNENLVKNQPIEFTREVVEKVYKYLLFEDKYSISENGNL